MTRSKARLISGAKPSIGNRDTLYRDGNCQTSKKKLSKLPKKLSKTGSSASNLPQPLIIEENIDPETQPSMSLTYEDLSKLLTTQNELNQQQMISLAKTFEKTHSSILSLNGVNTIKFPTFSGGGKEDANDFTRQVNLTASLYK